MDLKRHTAAAACLAAAGTLLWAQLQRLGRARAACACAVHPYSRRVQHASRRILLLGDSTGVGLGCEPARHSIAARLAADEPDADITNLCRTGARVADLLAQLHAAPEPDFDLVLVFAGGNDVLRWTPLDRLAQQAAELLAALRTRSPQVVWAGMANVGRAPLFLPPLSWLLSARARRVNRLLRRCAGAGGARFVEFFREPLADPFSAEPQRYFGSDGVHPSAEAYAWCWRHMRPALARAWPASRVAGPSGPAGG
jgi:lysophospholipase L1-like esterase